MRGPRAQPQSPAARRLATAAVLVLTGLALAAWLSGAGNSLPAARLGDENTFEHVLACEILRVRHAAASLGFYYPRLIPEIGGWLLRSRGDRAATTLPEHLAAASLPVLTMRAISACLSVLIVPATYRLARYFLDRPASLLAAAFTACSLLLFWHAPQARPHAVYAALSTVTLSAALDVRRTGSLRASVCAGVACALAVATLQTGVVLLAVLVVAHLLHQRRLERARRWYPLIPLLLVVASLRVFSPLLFAADPGRTVNGVPTRRFLPLPLLEGLDGRGVFRILGTYLAWDPWLISIAVIGAGWMLVRTVRSALRDGARLSSLRADPARADATVLAAYALPLFGVYALFAFTADRYLVTLLPFAALFAASLLPAFATRTRRWLGLRSLAHATALAGGLMLLPQAVVAWRLARVRAADDTAACAARWIEEHLARDSARITVMPGLELPLVRDERSSAWLAIFEGHSQPPWIRYQRELDAGERARLGWAISTPTIDDRMVAELREHPARSIAGIEGDHVVIEVWSARHSKFFARWRAELAARAELVARFSPWNAGSADERAFRIDDQDQLSDLAGGYFFYHLLRAERLGPVIEVYRLEKRRE